MTTDIAWLGDPAPRQALVVVSGIHGVEGFAGSAIQIAALRQLTALDEETAVVMVHALNPYGMACLRRFNQNNVDLNRNFYFSANSWQGEPKDYARLDPFFNPRRAPSRDFYLLRLLIAQCRFGEAAIRQAVAGGQHHYPQGLFYGGRGLEPEATHYIAWLQDSALLSTRRLMVLDLHTGLGPYGQQSIFLRSENIRRETLSEQLGLATVADRDESKVMGYDHSGGSHGAYQQLFAGEELVCLTVEYGTYSGRRLLYALRAENQHHHYGDRSLSHWSKQALKEAFCPAAEAWRGPVVNSGLDLINRSVAALAHSA